MGSFKSDPIKTVITISTGLLVIAVASKYMPLYKDGSLTISDFILLDWLLITATVLGLIGAFSLSLSKKIEFLWMKLSSLLSYIAPNILLSSIFYLFLFPISLMSKIGGKDPLSLRNDKDSVFKDVTTEFTKESFEKPW
ncbi:MAG: hypothetical protein HRT71_03810 [Flavobacteriales bacterium]|nr:hypothetical protein [Flavobacteriales bacterium]